TACGPGFSVTVTGSNYQASTIGVFGGDPSIPSGTALPTNVGSTTQLAASVAAGLISTPGTSAVYAATPVGATNYLVSNSVLFQVKPTPVIQQISPQSVIAGAQASLTVSISNYIPNVT